MRKTPNQRPIYKKPGMKCKTCQQVIALTSKRCPHCQNHQDFRRYFHVSRTMLALLVALISVISMSIPIVTKAITPDDSDLMVTYTKRADTTIPIIASNKGSRPAVLSDKGVLIIKFKRPDGSTANYNFFLSAVTMDKDGLAWGETREGLLVAENSSKQFFFAMDFNQSLPNSGFAELAAEFKKSGYESVSECVFMVSNTTFKGNQENTAITIFSKGAIEKAEPPEWRFLRTMLEASECIGKVPYPIRKQYKFQG